MMAENIWDHYFGTGDEYDPPLAADLADALEVAKPFVYPSRAALLEALAHANESAIRLRDTVYYEREHKFINELLDTLVGR